MAPPSNYVNTEMVDNYCFDSCEFQYNYQPIDLPNAIPNNNKIFQIPISNPNNYKCKFSGEKYKLTSVYIILNTDEKKQIQHTYERYETGTIIGELIMSHKNENNTHNLNICMAIKGVDFDTDLNEILNGTKENNKLFLNDYIPSKSYNYYDSNNNGGNSNTHWIVFDYNQHMLSINNNITSTGTDNIIVPEAPSQINSVQYHERGPQYMEKSRQVSCTRISTNLENSDSKSEKTLFKNGLFGQKDPVIVSLLFFILFIVFVFIVMGIIYIIKNRSSIFSSIKSTTTSGVDLVKKIGKSGES